MLPLDWQAGFNTDHISCYSAEDLFSPSELLESAVPRSRRSLFLLFLRAAMRFWIATSVRDIYLANTQPKCPLIAGVGEIKQNNLCRSVCRFTLRLSGPPLRVKATIWGKVSLAGCLVRLHPPPHPPGGAPYKVITAK